MTKVETPPTTPAQAWDSPPQQIFSTLTFLLEVLLDCVWLCDLTICRHVHGFILFPRINGIYYRVISCMLQFIAEILP